MSNRKFRFGVSGRGDTLAQWKDFAKKAEDLGYDTLDLPDHFSRQMAPMLALAVAGQVTSKLRFSTTMLDNDFRHPVMLAKEIATLDLLTEGRFEPGIGTGSQPHDNEMSGIPFDPPGVRVERIKETLQILRGYFGKDEALTFEGKYYQIKDLPSFPKPVQSPVPIMMGARGERMLRIAARQVDKVGILLAAGDTYEDLTERVAIVKQAAGDRYDQLELTRLYFNVSVDGAVSGAPPGRETGLVGSRDQIVEALQKQRDENDISYIMVIGPVIDSFAPVVAKLSGT